MEEALEQYLALAKTARGKSAEALVTQATSNPNTFVFGELIDLLTDLSPVYTELLDLFAYGTLADYERRRASLPELNPVQVRKLKMLTLVSFASTQRLLPFTQLQADLQISSQRELEDLVIDAIYHGLLVAKLDHKLQALQVSSTFGRDPRPAQVPRLLSQLSAFLSQVRQVTELAAKQQTAIEDHRTHTELRLHDFKERQKREKEKTITELTAMSEIRSKREDRFFMNFRPGFLYR